MDAETKHALEGVVVVAVWTKQGPIGGPGGAPALFYEAQEVLTDANGEFSLPGLRGFFPLSRIYGPRIIIFKPGYGSYPRFAPRTDWGDRLLSGEHVTLELIPARTREMRLKSGTGIDPVEVPEEKKRELMRLLRLDHDHLFPKR